MSQGVTYILTEYVELSHLKPVHSSVILLHEKLSVYVQYSMYFIVLHIQTPGSRGMYQGPNNDCVEPLVYCTVS